MAGLKSVQQLLETDLQEFILHGTTIVLPELIRLFECSDDSVTQLHEELQVLCIDLNLSRVRLAQPTVNLFNLFDQRIALPFVFCRWK